MKPPFTPEMIFFLQSSGRRKKQNGSGGGCSMSPNPSYPPPLPGPKSRGSLAGDLGAMTERGCLTAVVSPSPTLWYDSGIRGGWVLVWGSLPKGGSLGSEGAYVEICLLGSWALPEANPFA